jgi:hypothetical protein
MKSSRLISLIIFLVFQITISGKAQQIITKNDAKNKVIVFGNSMINITIDYNQKCNISCLGVNGQKVVEGTSGIFAQIKALNKTFSSLFLFA